MGGGPQDSPCPTRPRCARVRGGTKDPRCHSCAPPRTAEVPSEDTKDHYYKLPISREDIHFLASWEGLSRHKEELLQVGRRLQAAQQAPGLCAQQH